MKSNVFIRSFQLQFDGGQSRRFVCYATTATLILCWTAVSSASAQTLTAEQLFARASASVVMVKTFDRNGALLATGSGVVVSQNTVVTNCHVVAKASSIKVRNAGVEYESLLQIANINRDLCQLYVDSLAAPAVSVAKGKRLTVGQPVYAIGAPRGLELSLSEGIISSLRPCQTSYCIQTTTAISPGSSGGGLFDNHGQLIGITTLTYKESQNLNFALPAAWIADLVKGKIGATTTSSEQTHSSDGSISPRWILAAKTLESRAAWNELLMLAKDALKIAPKDVEAWYYSALANYKLKNTNDALADAKTALEINQDHWRSWFILGSTYAHQFPVRPDDAIKAFREVLRREPENVGSMVYLATMYRWTKQPNLAIDVLEKAAKIEPRNDEVWSQEDIAYLKSSVPRTP